MARLTSATDDAVEMETGLNHAAIENDVLVEATCPVPLPSRIDSPPSSFNAPVPQNAHAAFVYVMIPVPVAVPLCAFVVESLRLFSKRQYPTRFVTLSLVTVLEVVFVAVLDAEAVELVLDVAVRVAVAPVI